MPIIVFRRTLYIVRTIKAHSLNCCVPPCISIVPKDADLMVLLYSHSLCRSTELSSLLQTFGAKKTIMAIVDDTILGNGCSMLSIKGEEFNVVVERDMEQDIRVGRYGRVENLDTLDENLEFGSSQTRDLSTSVILGQKSLDPNSLAIVPATTYFSFDRKYCLSLDGRLLENDEYIKISLPGLPGPLNSNWGLRKLSSPITCFTAKGNILLTINNDDATKLILGHKSYTFTLYFLVNDDFPVRVLSGDPSRGTIALEGYKPKSSDYLQLCTVKKQSGDFNLKPGRICATTSVLSDKESKVFGAVCLGGYWSKGVQCSAPGFMAALKLPNDQ